MGTNVSNEELNNKNGAEGGPAYVAVDGKVYDVSGSSLWEEGSHMGRHKAGADLTEDIKAAPHGLEMLERVKFVGTVESEKPAAEPLKKPAPSVPGWAKFLLSFHPHPIIVHFPQATFTLAPMFLFMFYATGKTSFERTALYMVGCGAVTAAPAYFTGLLHWMYKYMSAPGKVFTVKLLMGQALMLMSIVTLYAHATAGRLPVSPINVPVAFLYCVLLAIAGVLGHAGGIIVFGSHKK